MITNKEHPAEGKGKRNIGIVISAIAIIMLISVSLPFVFGDDDYNNDLVLGDDEFDFTITDDMDVTGDGGIQAGIQEKINALADTGGIVTVGGTKTTVKDQMTLNIPAGITVIWKAVYKGGGKSAIILTGSGTFEVADGADMVSGDQYNIHAGDDDDYSDVSIIVSGGTIWNTYAAGGGICIVSGYGGVEVKDGELKFGNAGSGVYAEFGGNADVPILISGGTITAEGTYGQGLYLKTEGNSNVSATISNGTITANGSCTFGIFVSTSENSSISVTMNGGTIKAKGTFGYGIVVDEGSENSKIFITVNDNAVITAEGEYARAIGAWIYDNAVARITVNGGTISSKHYTIDTGAYDDAELYITVNDGTITAEGDNAYCIYAEAIVNPDTEGDPVVNIMINGGTMTAKGTSDDTVIWVDVYNEGGYVDDEENYWAPGKGDPKINVTVTDGVLTADWHVIYAEAKNCYGEDRDENDVYGDGTPAVVIKIDNGTLTAKKDTVIYGWAGYGATVDVIVNNGTITMEGNGDGIYVGANSNDALDDAKVSVVVNNGTIITKGKEGSGIYAYSEGDAVVSIVMNNGTIIAEDYAWGIHAISYDDSKINITMNGGTIIAEKGSWAIEAQAYDDSTVSVVTKGTITASGDNSRGISIDAADDAKVDLTISGGTITANGIGSKGVYAETYFEDVARYEGEAVPKASVTIVISGNAKINASGEGCIAVCTDVYAGTVSVTVNGGVVEAVSDKIGSYAIYMNGGNLIVNNGTIKSNSSRVIYAVIGDVTINGGTIDGALGGILVDLGTVEINGGLVKSAAKNYNTVAVTGEGSITVNGGRVVSGGTGDCGALFVKYGRITITDGIIQADNGVGLSIVEDGVIGITGGLIKAKTPIYIKKDGVAAFLKGTINANAYDDLIVKNGVIVEVGTLNVTREYDNKNTGITIIAGKALTLDDILWSYPPAEAGGEAGGEDEGPGEEGPEGGEVIGAADEVPEFNGPWLVFSFGEGYDIEWVGAGPADDDRESFVLDTTMALVAVIFVGVLAGSFIFLFKSILFPGKP